ncbi:acidic leucine-rich nuclear phosphoprotein 32 family member E-like [Macadamia integrifolia]|uniref:acidic leucine-rich nuclear phosphoprotein 32 family member E-like n=1 Tax=Macadamia integrifolia TaxID=60698 RepID=UPI001C4F9652|nr:acidic leucine-rich nuclear phosphoprotein 32 family member E-like [Macadamia integrifolia]
MRPVGILDVALLLLFSAIISLILFFSFSMSPSVSQDQSFLGSTYELIMKAKSSPVFVFFACNLIVVAIFLESSTSSYRDFDWFHESLSSLDHVEEEEEEEEKGEATKEDDDDEDEDEDEEFHGYDGYEEDNDDDGDDDGELEKRIEEFIAKINGAWRAEWLMEMKLPT